MAKRSQDDTPQCSCGTAQRYEMCCGRYHAGQPAPDAQSLMRSRYCAFVLCNAPYLLRTWHHTTQPESITFEPQQKWLGLKVVRSAVSGNTAEVEFIARFRLAGGSAQRHHELSRFLLENGQWSYVDGEVKH